ncbi:MAG: hypothetical protein ACRDG4_09335 [Chloroflexota bacterium]
MPSNRRRRRAQAARTRHTARAPHPFRSPLTRIALGAGGVACIAIAVVVMVTPHGVHAARAFSFLFVLGGALLIAAWLV